MFYIIWVKKERKTCRRINVQLWIISSVFQQKIKHTSIFKGLVKNVKKKKKQSKCGIFKNNYFNLKIYELCFSVSVKFVVA